MTYAANFIPSTATQPYAYLEHYIKVEDAKGRTLYTRTFDSRASLKKGFEDFSVSKTPHSFQLRTFLPVRYHDKRAFFRSIVFPQTLTAISVFEKKRILQIAATPFAGLFDIATAPFRIFSLIPYVIYDKWIKKKEADHRIIALIKNQANSDYALDKGKVIVRCITEDFSRIQIGTVNGELSFRVQGFVTSSFSDVYIRRPLCVKGIRKSEETYASYSGNVNSNITSLYHAFAGKKLSNDCK